MAESDGERLERMGVDGAAWAHEFMSIVMKSAVIDEGLMISWFANAIEAGRAAGRAGSGRLQEMLDAQDELQTSAYGITPKLLDGKERADFLRSMTLALEDELHEALNEVGWKPWATSTHMNRDRFAQELVDAWHFFMNLMLVAGMNEKELFDRYMKKREVNARRQITGYDGVSGKCAECHADLNELDDKLGIVSRLMRGMAQPQPLRFCNMACHDRYFKRLQVISE